MNNSANSKQSNLKKLSVSETKLTRKLMRSLKQIAKIYWSFSAALGGRVSTTAQQDRAETIDIQTQRPGAPQVVDGETANELVSHECVGVTLTR